MVKIDSTTKALNSGIKIKNLNLDELTDCIICNSNKQSLVFKDIRDFEYETYKPVDYAICRNCGLIFQSPLPEPNELPGFYPDEYRNYLPEKDNLFSFLKKIQFLNLVKEVIRYFPENPQILEIGFGNGELLLALKKKGYKKLFGTDFTDKTFLSLEGKGIKLKISNVEDKVPFDEKFDVIIMNNVIEHFLNPKRVLENCKKILTQNGRIILITPNSDALEFSIFKKYWAGFHAPRHTFIFNERNIRLLAQKLGFSGVITSPYLDPGQWSISIQNIFQDTNITKSKLKNGMAWYLLPLSIICFPVTLLENLIKKSTSIMCVLQN